MDGGGGFIAPSLVRVDNHKSNSKESIRHVKVVDSSVMGEVRRVTMPNMLLSIRKASAI